MKKIIVILSFLFTHLITNATNYYISSVGSDANNGTSINTPWKTISKLNSSFAIINAGDSILFKRGDVFIGPLIVGKSGTINLRINFGAYGTGAKPIITGFTTVSSWTLVSTGVYQATVTGGTSNPLWLITVNGSVQRMGRFPNADSANGGYLTATSVNNTSLTITSTGLPTTINWTGANAIVKKNDFILDLCPITAQTTTTITYTNPPAGQIPTAVDNTYGAKVGYGFFIQNDIRTLDRFGEWYYNPTTKVLNVFFGNLTPASYAVKASTVDTVINCGGANGRTARSYLTFNNLAIEGGNDFGILAKDGSYITVTNCDFNANRDAINFWSIPNQIVQYSTFTNTLNNAIQLRGRTSGGPTTIRKNTVSKCSLFSGMGRSGDGYYNAIRTDGDNATIEYNRVDSVGFNGIQFGNTNQYVQYNYVSNFCMTKEDGGGIYIYNTTQTYTNRNITNNIVLNAIGNTTGTNHTTLSNTRCIYLDGMSSTINVLNNVVAYSPNDLVLMNSNQNVRLTGNLFYSAPYGITFFKYGGAFQPLANITFTSNIVVPTLENIHYRNQDNPVTLSMTADIRALVGKFDSNAYRPSIQGMLKIEQGDGASFKSYVPFSVKGWQTLLGSSNELNSKITDSLKGYTSVSIVGANKTTNPTFDANITGTTSNGTIAYDNTSKITGVGSVRISSATLDSSWSASTSNTTTVYQIVGALTLAKKYIAKFSTKGTTTYGYARVYLQSSGGVTISNISYVYFDTAIVNHEVLLTCTATASSNARYVIAFSKTQSPIYLDNYYLYEATTTTVALSTAVNFQFNADSVAKTVILSGTWKDMKTGALYTGSITLQPYTGVLLTLQPNAVLRLSRVIKTKPLVGNLGLSDRINSDIALYPNPTFNKINLSLNSNNSDNGLLSVVNMQGSTMYKQKLKIDLGKNVFALSTSGLTTGEYVINLKVTNNTIIDKFIKL